MKTAAAKAAPRVYVYERVSDAKQVDGTGLTRQNDAIERCAKQNRIPLDGAIRLRDEGKSGYHGDHVKRGEFGAFLNDVKVEKIPRGSILIVEDHDRLSRGNIMQAMGQLYALLGAGIRVFVAKDNSELTEESLTSEDGAMGQFFSTAVEQFRANGESARKARLVRGALRKKCQNWQEGNGMIRAGSDPNWLCYNTETKRFEFIPEREAGVRLAIDLFRQGYGMSAIAQQLASEGYDLTSTRKKPVGKTPGNPARALRNLFTLEALTGKRTFTLDKSETFTLDNYYPAILSDGEFAEIQQLRNRRTMSGMKSEIPSVLTGIRVIHCAYCGDVISAQNMKIKDAIKRRLVCASYQHGKKCRVGGSMLAAPIERAVMEFCSDAFNLASLFEVSRTYEPFAARLAKLRGEIATLETQETRIADLFLEADSAPPASFVKKAREIETKLAMKRAEADQVGFELQRSVGKDSPATADLWSSLIEGVERLDIDARMKVRRLMMDTFERIDLYMKGWRGRSPKTIVIALQSKRGVTRHLEIDRISGQWKADDLEQKNEASAAERLPKSTRRRRNTAV